MRDASAVEELECGGEVADDLGGLGLGEPQPPLDLSEEGRIIFKNLSMKFWRF